MPNQRPRRRIKPIDIPPLCDTVLRNGPPPLNVKEAAQFIKGCIGMHHKTFEKYRRLGLGPEHIGWLERGYFGVPETLVPRLPKIEGAEYWYDIKDPITGERYYTMDALRGWISLLNEGYIKLPEKTTAPSVHLAQ